MTEKKIVLKRDGHLIYITRSGDGKQLRYNLKRKCLEKKSLSSWRGEHWHKVAQQYAFFRGYSVCHIVCKEEHFLRLIRLAMDLNPKCMSVSTFLTRLDQALIYENYMKEGIRAEHYKSYRGSVVRLKRPLEYYPRDFQKLFKKYDVCVTRGMESRFEQDYEFMLMTFRAFAAFALKQGLDNEEFGNQWKSVLDRIDTIKELHQEYKYDLMALFGYVYGYLVPFEAYGPYGAFGDLLDYYRMASRMGRNVKKYPKYLKSMHDIIYSNYRAFKEEYDEIAFSERRLPHLEYQGKKFCVAVPSVSKEILEEGVSLNHCVSSYVKKIIDGKTYIMFLRLVEEPENSLITLEYKMGRIVQAKGSYNRPMTEEEKKFLLSYAKKKRLEVAL